MTACFFARSAVLLFSLGLALYYDLKETRIKNFITLPAALTGLALNVYEGGITGLQLSLKGWLMPILALLILYRINVMGAGDIKLFAAIGAIMGLPFTVYCFMFSVYIGGLISVGLLWKRKQFKRRMLQVLNYVKFILVTKQIPVYVSEGDTGSKFIFSAAIVPGAIVQFLLAASWPDQIYRW